MRITIGCIRIRTTQIYKEEHRQRSGTIDALTFEGRYQEYHEIRHGKDTDNMLMIIHNDQTMNLEQ